MQEPVMVQVGAYQVEKHVLTYVAAELCQYPHRRARLDALEGTGPKEALANRAPIAGLLSEDGALSAAVVRARSLEREKAFLQGFCRSVEVVMDGLPLRHQTVIRVVCFEGADQPMSEHARTLDMNPYTVEKRKGVALVAFVAGLMGDDRLARVPEPELTW